MMQLMKCLSNHMYVKLHNYGTGLSQVYYVYFCVCLIIGIAVSIIIGHLHTTHPQIVARQEIVSHDSVLATKDVRSIIIVVKTKSQQATPTIGSELNYKI